MLNIIIPETEGFNEETNEFITYKAVELRLEHSLVSISKWEEKWHKPFLSSNDKTLTETVDYIKCMTITQNVDEHVYARLTQDNVNAILKYIDDPRTATKVSTKDGAPNREIVTSELIYYWMITYGIPFECQKWHLNRLLTLIQVCSIKNAPSKKMSKSAIASQNANLNAARRKMLNTRG